ncbi:MAG: subtilisin-like proprotein convertase family protein, partial [Hyphomicrobiaceae bacterium]
MIKFHRFALGLLTSVVFLAPANAHAAFCGDGVVDSGEECDEGSANSNALPFSCRVDCTVGDITDICFAVSDGTSDGSSADQLLGVNRFTGETALIGPSASVQVDNSSSGTFSNQSSCSSEMVRTFSVGSHVSVADLDVGLNVSHTWRGSLRVQLSSPSGTIVTLIDRLSGDSTDNFDLLLDDISSASAHDGSDDNVDRSIYGCDRVAGPDNPLAAFNGEDSFGTWTLKFCNSAQDSDPNTGTLTFNSARLVFNSESASTFNIEAIALIPSESALYAANGGSFGELDLTTGVFTAIGN